MIGPQRYLLIWTGGMRGTLFCSSNSGTDISRDEMLIDVQNLYQSLPYQGGGLDFEWLV